MALAILFSEIIFLLILTLIILNKYGNWKRQRVFVTLSTLFAWYFSFIIISILPLDVSMTSYYQCLANENFTYMKNNCLNINKNILMPPLKTYVHDYSIESINTTKKHYSKKRILNYKRDLNVFSEETFEFSKCETPWNFIPKPILISLWRIVYWTSQVLTWLIIPMMQSYSKAGDFNVLGKIKTAFLENLLWYGTYLILFIIMCIYVALKPGLDIDISKLLIIASSASNTWGLILLVLLLGYGLIQVPRSVWYYSAFVSGGHTAKLARAFYKASIVYPMKQEADENLEDISQEVLRLAQAVPSAHPTYNKINILICKVPEKYKAKYKSSIEENNGFSSRFESAIEYDPPTPKTLVKIHKRLIACLTSYYRANMQWQAILDTLKRINEEAASFKDSAHKYRTDGCYIDEDLSKYITATVASSFDGVNGDDKVLTRNLFGSNATPKTAGSDDLNVLTGGRISSNITRFMRYLARYTKIIVIQTKRFVRPVLYKILALVFFVLSVALIWSELFMFKRRQPILSLFALLFQLAKSHLHKYIVVEFVSGLTITYLSLCAYFTIFRLRIFDLYCLLPNHHTDEYSLLFSGMLISRLTSPLCLNFLSLIHMDQGYEVPIRISDQHSSTPNPTPNNYSVSSIINNGTPTTTPTIPQKPVMIETAFIHVMGRQTLIPFIGQGFNVYFPMLITLLCILNYFDVVRKIGRSVGYNRFTTGDFNRFYWKTRGKISLSGYSTDNASSFNNKRTDSSVGYDGDDDDLGLGNVKNSSAPKISAMIQEGRLLVKKEFRNRYLISHNYKDLEDATTSSNERRTLSRSSVAAAKLSSSQQQRNTFEALRKKYGTPGSNSLFEEIPENNEGNTAEDNYRIDMTQKQRIYTSRDDLLPKKGSHQQAKGVLDSSQILSTASNTFNSMVGKVRDLTKPEKIRNIYIDVKDKIKMNFDPMYESQNRDKRENFVNPNLYLNSSDINNRANSVGNPDHFTSSNTVGEKTSFEHSPPMSRLKIVPRNLFEDI